MAYLAYILAAMPQEEDRIRTIAGYLLKNNARLILRASPEVLAYVKASVLQAFTDPSVMVRNAAGQDIVAFLGILEPKNWPECLQQLVHTLDSTVSEHQEVCLLNSSQTHVSKREPLSVAVFRSTTFALGYCATLLFSLTHFIC